MSLKHVGFSWRHIEEYELSDLLSVSSPLQRVWWLLGADSGLRRSEIKACRTDHIIGDRLYVPHGKGDKSRWTCITNRTVAAIVYASISGPVYPYAFTGNTINIKFRQRCLYAGLNSDHLVLHSLRHRFATMLLRQGIPLFDIMDLLGHTDIKTTAVYLHSDPRRFSAARKALECSTFLPSLFERVEIPELR